MEKMIKVLELRKIKKNIKDRNILTIEKLILPSNGIVFIDGESGAGKSTLLNIIGSLDTPTTGDVIFNGQSIYDKQYNINDYRKNAIGIVFQDNDLFEDLSVKDNLKTYDINEIKI